MDTRGTEKPIANLKVSYFYHVRERYEEDNYRKGLLIESIFLPMATSPLFASCFYLVLSHAKVKSNQI